MSWLVADLLLLGQADNGQALERKSLDLVPIVARAVDRARRLFPDHLIESTTPPSAMTTGDADRLGQAIWNLIENAARYTPAGGRILVLLSLAGNMAEIAVSDTGIGIAPRHLPRIFERFYRVDPARSRRSGGSGLGLAIVEYVVEAHGGTASVSSAEGEGTSFTLRFPIVRTGPDSGPDPERAYDGLAAASPSAGRAATR